MRDPEVHPLLVEAGALDPLELDAFAVSGLLNARDGEAGRLVVDALEMERRVVAVADAVNFRAIDPLNREPSEGDKGKRPGDGRREREEEEPEAK